MVVVRPEEGANMAKSLHEKTKEKVADSFELAQVFAQARVGEYPDNQELVHMGDQLVRGLSDMLCQWEDFLEMIPPGASLERAGDGQGILPYTEDPYPDCHSRHELAWQRCIPDRRNPICRSMCGFGPVPSDTGVLPGSAIKDVVAEHCAEGYLGSSTIDAPPWTEEDWGSAMKHLRESWDKKAAAISALEDRRTRGVLSLSDMGAEPDQVKAPPKSTSKSTSKSKGRTTGAPARKRGR
jgi:hypothetical protein